MENLIKRDKKKIYLKAIKGKRKNVVGVDIKFKEPLNSNLILENNSSKKFLNNLVGEIIKKIKIME